MNAKTQGLRNGASRRHGSASKSEGIYNLRLVCSRWLNDRALDRDVDEAIRIWQEIASKESHETQ